MPDEPQNPTATPAPLRDERGRLVAGGGSLNPSGEHKWLADVKKELQGGSATAAAYLVRVVEGKEAAFALAKDGVEVKIELAHKDRIAAAKVLLEFTVPKPKDHGDQADTAARTALAERILARLAGLDS